MLQHILHFSIKNKLIVLLFVLGLVGWGGYALKNLPIDAVPDITDNQILVITSVPSLSAPDVERFITAPIELATRNINGIVEQRSFSRFGLSLVTIVFNDKTDVYWARQQVSERLQKVKEEIPAGMGAPELGPVTTGLGEIFQYVVKTKPCYEAKYDLTALRSIQDWIVRRQLLSTEGVAEVSSFGGTVKQYEVAVKTDKLKSFNLSISDVFNALQKNNQNAGGAYIEKAAGVLFIRSEGLVQSIADINATVIKNNSYTPILIRDVAEVKFGNAVRYGATVYGNKGEVAGAVVMMLKGENSNKVIGHIKEKIEQVKKSLPEGVIIEPFLDRSKMVNKAIRTVSANLIEGALIVILILVFFLGNMRAGFIVASVIPLSMLFAIIMMQLFGISGNLMSLGAIDFGLLVDGTIIIVEAILYYLGIARIGQQLTQQQMDEDVLQESGKIRNAASFGELIILVVYLPILALEGIEGKMFRPMAQTVSFAIIGAFILSLTYIPVMCSLFLQKKIKAHNTWSDRFIQWLQKTYSPLLRKAMQRPISVICTAVVFLVAAIFIFRSLGGEFIPELEEGDFAVETRMLTGTSLSTTVSNVQKASDVLLKKFPEVEKVVTKIGAGEVPTDPMPIEAADMMVILKDKKEWKSASSFDELAEKMSTALEEVPGVSTGFQYPVQMRFNELMTGARQDVVCKIFGDNLDSLAAYAEKAAAVIATINGAKDIYKETVTGISQIVIRYNREAIARYGTTISEVNEVIQTAYAGSKAGFVFENDQRYDLVVRLANSQRNDITQLNNLSVSTPSGQLVPLNLLATIQVEEGPYQVQREDARRRITVAFNVRGRDVQSIVKELQDKLQQSVKLSPGYYFTYGGQYENLAKATNRLVIVVPIALLLILVLLFFAFRKMKYGLLIFTAIPLSAIGGVLALWLRGMPFSISAAIGFIALFGVAVLNGIVLIAEINRLKERATASLQDIIVQATTNRLRPILITAAVASLGFLPMAISNGAGAEVQRPLATVVMGGLLTATILTLFILPCIYLVMERKTKIILPATVVKLVLIVCFFGASLSGNAQLQTSTMSLQTVKETVSANGSAVKLSELQENYIASLKATAKNIPKTNILTEFGQYNSQFFDGRIALSQDFSSAALYQKQATVFEKMLATAKTQTVLEKGLVRKMSHQLYIELQYLFAQKEILLKSDSVYSRFKQLAAIRHEKGESNILEKTSLENMVVQNQLQVQMLQNDILSIQSQLAILMQNNIAVIPSETLVLQKQLFDSSLIRQHPYLRLFQEKEQLGKAETNVEIARLKPEWQLGISNQSFQGWQEDKNRTARFYNMSNRFTAVTAGIAVPIFNKAQKAKVEAAKKNEAVMAGTVYHASQNLKTEMIQAWQSNEKFKEACTYYQKTALPNAVTIVQFANQQYKSGQINYIEWGNLVQQAKNIELNYIINLKEQNIAAANLAYLLNEQ